MSKLLEEAQKHGFPWEEVVESLLAKAPGTLDSDEKAFLRARRDTLTDAQIEVYAIDEEQVEEKSPERLALEEEATALGLEFTDRVSDAALTKKIEKARA